MGDFAYFGFVISASRHTRNESFPVWVIHYPFSQLFAVRGICISFASNNITKYNFVINLLSEEIAYGIELILVNLDSQLVVS